MKPPAVSDVVPVAAGDSAAPRPESSLTLSDLRLQTHTLPAASTARSVDCGLACPLPPRPPPEKLMARLQSLGAAASTGVNGWVVMAAAML